MEISSKEVQRLYRTFIKHNTINNIPNPIYWDEEKNIEGILSTLLFLTHQLKKKTSENKQEIGNKENYIYSKK